MRQGYPWVRGIAWVGMLLTVVLPAGSAEARRRHVVQTGETLHHIARAYGCSVEQIQRANRLDTTLIRQGRQLSIPACKAAAPAAEARRAHGNTRRSTSAKATPREARLRRAMAALDRASAGGPLTIEDVLVRDESPREVAAAIMGRSVGRPWQGRLRDAIQLPSGEGYFVRRPHRAWGAPHVVSLVQDVIAEFRSQHTDAHTIAIGDLSAESGGPISEHRSHQSGRDIDVGLMFTKAPAGYPASFVVANADLDLARNWSLLMAFIATRSEPGGVRMVFLDYAIQQRLVEWAQGQGVPQSFLDELFQYPRGRNAAVGWVRHEPNHDDHLHIRFGCDSIDPGCE